MGAKSRLFQILAGVVFLIFALSLLIFTLKPDGKLHLVFCDVGQGDAILLTTPKGSQVLIDGGPNNKVLSCLGRKMPFWDREIELVVLTHPQADHLTGLIEVLRRYQVGAILTTKATNDTPEFQVWQQKISQKEAIMRFVKKGDLIDLGSGANALVEWPIDGEFPFGQPSDLNASSVILKVQFGQFCALLTGDAPAEVFETISQTEQITFCPVFKVPHHGSRNSLSANFWRNIAPKLAIISVGKDNRYGHPHSEVINFLTTHGARILRTDREGNIEIITDGSAMGIR